MSDRLNYIKTGEKKKLQYSKSIPYAKLKDKKQPGRKYLPKYNQELVRL